MMKTFNLIVRKYRHGKAKYSFINKSAKAAHVSLELQTAIAQSRIAVII